MKEIWNERYSKTESAYGKLPNVFFEKQLVQFPKGKILLPAEGEGRNGIFAAKNGWDVFAFDLSEAGKNKALHLAEMNKVSINYKVGDFNDINFEPESFDVIALIYAHFSAESKSIYHKKLISYLKSGGSIIFEAFSKKHLSYKEKYPNVGGPGNVDMLFSIEEIQNDFSELEILYLKEVEIELNEGVYHQGIGSVIRFIGTKK